MADEKIWHMDVFNKISEAHELIERIHSAVRNEEKGSEASEDLLSAAEWGSMAEKLQDALSSLEDCPCDWEEFQAYLDEAEAEYVEKHRPRHGQIASWPPL